MKGSIHAGAFVVGLGLTCMAPAPARAESPAAVREVVVVAAGGGAVDGVRLRKAIGDELGVDAVAPGDPRAPLARGTIEVSTDEAARALVVSYREKNGTPIVRRIDRPGDDDATLRAAVLLAGNLARDEASELAEMLRRKAPAPEVVAASAADPELESDDDLESKRDVERMGQILAWYAGQNRTLRTAVAWSAVGLGVALEGLSIYCYAEQKFKAGLLLSSSGLGLVTVGGHAEPSGWLDELRRYHARDMDTGRPPGLVRDDVEAMWLWRARTERKWRLVSGWVGVVFVAGATAYLVPALVADPRQVALAPFFAGLGSAELGLSIASFSSPGPVEAALRSYERATGRTVWRDGPGRVEPVVSLTLGGGALGVRGTF